MFSTTNDIRGALIKNTELSGWLTSSLILKKAEKLKL